MNIIHFAAEAYQYLQQGKIIAYPTEAVYGLGCDPFNREAVMRLLVLKQRAIEKGLILLIADWSQLEPLIGEVSVASLAAVKASWPGPVTWVFPKSAIIPYWLSGDYHTIAIRMSAHPVAHALCKQGPIVSTSANLSGFAPACDFNELILQFPKGIDAFLTGELGKEKKPSAIYEIGSGKRLR